MFKSLQISYSTKSLSDDLQLSLILSFDSCVVAFELFVKLERASWKT